MHFQKIGIKSGIYFRKIGIKSGIHFGKIGSRNGYVFETSMARPRPKSGQVPPPGLLLLFLRYLEVCREATWLVTKS